MRRKAEVRVERIADPRPATRVAAKGAGKSGGTSGGTTTPHQPTEMPNTLRSRSMARVIEVLSEGVVYGLHDQGVTLWQSVYMNGTPLVDASGNWQLTIREGQFRYGYPSQDYIHGYPVAEAPFNVGVETQFGVPIVRTCNTPPLNSIRYILRIPALYTSESDGDVVEASVAYAFDISINFGTWTNVVTERISGKTTSPYERAVRIQLPVASPNNLQIRVERIDPDPPTNTAAKLFWAAYVEIIDGTMAYDDTCLVAMTLDAETFPTLPQRGYLLDGIMVELPTNYNGRSHGYSGDWDGNFYTQWTNNPAWVLYALLSNERWGLGRYLDVVAIDKWSFYEAGVSNDGGVPDGKGGTEVRWTCNCIINTRQDAYSVLNAVASSMLGRIYWSNGTVFLVQDRRIAAPTRLFSNADVESGIFNYQGTDYRGRWTAVAVTWNDPTDNYEPAVELVMDTTLISQQGYRETQQTAFGCTSRGQAQRIGRWLIYTSQFETETVTFRIGLENADLQPGDLVAISDPSRVGARLGGRLLDDAGANTVTLDRVPDEMAVNPHAWSLYVTTGSADAPAPPYPGPVVISLGVTARAGNRLTVTGKPATLAAGSMWIAASSAVVPRYWRVAGVSDVGDTSYEVMATEYHQEKFDYVDRGVLIPPPPFSLIPTGPLVAPSDLSFKEYIYLDGSGFPQFGVIISWSASPDARVTRYQMEMAGPGGDYRRYSHLAGVAQDVPAMRQGEWLVTLLGFDNIGRRSAIVRLTFTPVGLLEKPLTPLALYLAPQGQLTTVTWVPTGEIDVVFYWLKWSPVTDGSATWERATTSIARVDRNTTQVSTPTRAGTLMLKAIDALGQESVSWVAAILLPQITERVHIIDEIEQPDWLGARGPNWHQNLGELWLPPPLEAEPVTPGLFPGDRGLALNQTPTRDAIYLFEQDLDLGLVCNTSMVGIVEGYGTTLGTTMSRWVPLSTATPLASGLHNSISNWVPLASAVPLARGSTSAWDAHIECRVSQDGSAFAPWFPLKSTLIAGRRFQWRLVGQLYDLATTLRTTRAEVQVEIPLRNVQGEDVALDGTGHLTVTYPIGFLTPPTVQLTARQNLAPGGNIVITLSDRDKFRVEHRNAAGAAVAGGNIDYFVQGFGGHA